MSCEDVCSYDFTARTEEAEAIDEEPYNTETTCTPEVCQLATPAGGDRQASPTPSGTAPGGAPRDGEQVRTLVPAVPAAPGVGTCCRTWPSARVGLRLARAADARLGR